MHELTKNLSGVQYPLKGFVVTKREQIRMERGRKCETQRGDGGGRGKTEKMQTYDNLKGIDTAETI